MCASPVDFRSHLAFTYLTGKLENWGISTGKLGATLTIGN